MMHDYNYGTRFESEGSPTALSAYADNVRILPEVSAAFTAQPTRSANTHGEQIAGRRFFGAYNFIVEVLLSYGTPETPAGVYDSMAGVLARFMNPNEKVYLTRNAPGQGDVEIPIIVLQSPQTGDPRHRLLIPCRALEPFWQAQGVSFNAVNPTAGITVTGSAPINDAVVVFSGTNGTQRLTHTTTGDYIELNTDTTAQPVTVDVGEKTIKQAGSHLDGVDTISAPWWLELQPGANAFTLSGGGSSTLTAREKYL